MSGLREQKKQQAKQNIIHAAHEIFTEKGYQKATMPEIAKRAEVGTGTIYNYFTSKGLLLLTVFAAEVDKMSRHQQNKQQTTDEHPVRMIRDIILQFADLFQLYPKTFWKELFHVMTAEMGESPQLRTELFGMDQEIMAWITTIIDTYQQTFSVPLHGKETAYVIYGISMTNTFIYIYDDNMTIAQYKQALVNQIDLFFAGKCQPS